jgi:hypothetical protein
MLYSPTFHSNGASGFLFDSDANAPADAFAVSESDVEKCINAPSGSTYEFAAPASGETVGTLTLTAPAAPTAAQKLASASMAQAGAMMLACAAEIQLGFPSSALGSAYTYPTKNADQRNLIGATVASSMPGLPSGWTISFWCEDSASVWQYEPHTASQIQQVMADAVTARESASSKLKNKKDAIAAVSQIASWAAGTPAKGDEIADGNGGIWSCTTSGKTGSSAPSWPASPASAATVNDGSAVWSFVETQEARVQAIAW